MINGLITGVQRFSLHDGPGIRTTVFFKGCALRCRWCHNPETFAAGPETLFFKERCISCHRCTQGLSCPTGARTLSGDEVSVEELTALVLRDEVFYQGVGGVTLSGGEALLQIDFVQAFLKKIKERGIHTCVDTSLCAAKEVVGRAAKYTDLFLADMKAVDPVLFRGLTGGDNRIILENLSFIDALEKPFILRVPLLSGYNDTDAELDAMARLFMDYKGLTQVDIFPVLNHADAKYHALSLAPEAFNTGISLKPWVQSVAGRLRGKTRGKVRVHNLYES